MVCFFLKACLSRTVSYMKGKLGARIAVIVIFAAVVYCGVKSSKIQHFFKTPRECMFLWQVMVQLLWLLLESGEVSNTCRLIGGRTIRVKRPAVGMSAGRFTIYMSKKEMAYFKYLSKKLIISSFTESWKNSLVPWPA